MSHAAPGWAPDPALERIATHALVLGVLNVVCFGPPAGVPAIVLGLRARSTGWKATTAVWLGVFGSLFWTLAVFGYLHPWVVHFS